MKNVLNYYQGLALVFFLFSCNNGASDSVKNAKDSNAAKIESQKKTELPPDSLAIIPQKPDADLLVSAASGSMMEVQLGQLAQTNSANQRVKAFGTMMIEDHGEEGTKLKNLAIAKNITLPDAVSNSQQKEIESLREKTGNDFDKAYIISMVSDHKGNINAFEKEAKKGTDPQITAFVNNHLAMLHRHLDAANSLKQQLGITDIQEIPPITK